MNSFIIINLPILVFARIAPMIDKNHFLLLSIKTPQKL